jgi:predicted Zn-dependent protease
MKHFLVAAALASLAFTASALPTVSDVQAEVAKGNYVQAELMMGEVVAAKPDSARGHYVYAEFLAHEKWFAKAAEELARAKAIDPQHGFAAPEKFLAFEQLLQR